MGRIRELSTEKRAQIVILHRQKMHTRRIAALLGIAQSSVVKSIKRFQELGSFQSRKRSGRPRVTNARMDSTIKRIVQRSPRASSSLVRARLPGNDDSKPSTQTIRRRLFGSGLKSYRPAKKPHLSKKNIMDRLAFCRKYSTWSAEQWEKVLFSDESTFTQFYSFCRHVRRPVGQRFNPRYTVATVKQAPKVMVWGCVSGAGGRGGLWVMPKNTTINGTVYLNILKEKVNNFIQIHGATHFQHDGAPCHNTKIVKDWLAAQEITVIGPWPGNSPDLNIIENVWKIMKNKVSALNPSSEEKLIECIKKVWVSDISIDVCRRLAHTMPNRIREVLKNKGYHCKY